MSMSVEMLTPERVVELWAALEPMFAAACEGHAIAKDEMTANDIYVLAVTGMAAVFAGFRKQKPACVVALQFNHTNGVRCADVIAMAGVGLLQFKARYWNSILDWLRANDVKFLDAYTPINRIDVYKNKFGFDKSCAYIRMTL